MDDHWRYVGYEAWWFNAQICLAEIKCTHPDKYDEYISAFIEYVNDEDSFPISHKELREAKYVKNGKK